MNDRENKNDIKENLINEEERYSRPKICVADLAVTLKKLAKVFETRNVANDEMSNALNRLSSILLKYKDIELEEVLNRLRIVTLTKRKGEKVKPKNIISLEEAKSFDLEYIKKLINTGNLSKSDLVIIGVGRFGMSGAELVKTRRERIVENLLTAIANIKTIEIIGNAASKP